MGTHQRDILLFSVLLILVILVLWWARQKCHLGRFSAPSCKTGGESFACGGDPDPGALAEAWGLYELGVRSGPPADVGMAGNQAEGFCSQTPAPGAVAEFEGLEQLGWRPGADTFQGAPAPNKGCGATASPASIAEAQALQHAGALAPGAPYYTKGTFAGAPAGSSTPSGALTQLKGPANPTHVGAHGLPLPGHWPPTPIDCSMAASPTAIAEAQALQRAKALAPGAPYYTKGTFTGGPNKERYIGEPPCGARNTLAVEEAQMLLDLGGGAPSLAGGQGATSGNAANAAALSDPTTRSDALTSHRLHRDEASLSAMRAHKKATTSTPGHVSNRQARMESMRQGFGGPAGTGYGWTTSDGGLTHRPTPATGSWGPAPTVVANRCYSQCTDGCTGTNCRDYCTDYCVGAAVEAGTGTY